MSGVAWSILLLCLGYETLRESSELYVCEGACACVRADVGELASTFPSTVVLIDAFR